MIKIDSATTLRYFNTNENISKKKKKNPATVSLLSGPDICQNLLLEASISLSPLSLSPSSSCHSPVPFPNLYFPAMAQITGNSSKMSKGRGLFYNLNVTDMSSSSGPEFVSEKSRTKTCKNAYSWGALKVKKQSINSESL